MNHYFHFYNQERIHLGGTPQSLNYLTPTKVYKDACLVIEQLSEKANKNDN
jgi:hypothetical protein